jgi:hypothetical protein
MHDLDSMLPAPDGQPVDHAPPVRRPTLPDRAHRPAVAPEPAPDPAALAAVSPPTTAAPQAADVVVAEDVRPDDVVAPRLAVPWALMLAARIGLIVALSAVASQLDVVGRAVADDARGSAGIELEDVAALGFLALVAAALVVITSAWWSQRALVAYEDLHPSALRTVGFAGWRWVGYPGLFVVLMLFRQFDVFGENGGSNIGALRPPLVFAAAVVVSFVAINPAVHVLKGLGRRTLAARIWWVLEAITLYVAFDTWNRRAFRAEVDMSDVYENASTHNSAIAGLIMIGLVPLAVTAWSISRGMRRRVLDLQAPVLAMDVPAGLVFTPTMQPATPSDRTLVPMWPFAIGLIVGHAAWGAALLVRSVMWLMLRSAVNGGANQASLDRLATRVDAMLVVVVITVLVMFVAQWMWCIVAAANTARVSIAGPPLSLAWLLFGIPLGMIAAGLALLVAVPVAGVLLIACGALAAIGALGLSFRLMGTCAAVVGGDPRPFRNWSFIVTSMYVLQWVARMFGGSDLSEDGDLLREAAMSGAVGLFVLVGLAVGAPALVQFVRNAREFRQRGRTSAPSS